jgi:hypothetical protein
MLERKEISEQVRGAIAKLPEMYRAVVELRDLNGLTFRETADSLFLTTPAVKSRHLRGRSLLSDLMREPNGSLGGSFPDQQNVFLSLNERGDSFTKEWMTVYREDLDFLGCGHFRNLPP